MAKYLDDNGLLYFWQKIKTIFATQQDLSDLEETVQGIVSEGGEPNVIDTVKVNGSALTPDANKAVNITVGQGSANGTIAVNGSDVSVKGLGSAAYTASTAYDTSGAAAAVLGSSTDAATANTVYGAKAAAAAAQADADALETLVGSTSVSSQITSAVNALDSSITAETNKAIASVTITNGKISASTKVTIPTNNNQLTNGAGYQTASDVSAAIAESGGEANVIETVKVNGTAQTVTDKAVDITVPTAGTSTPVMDGTGAVGTSSNFARADHVHPKDTSKANLASPTFTGTPKAPTATAGTNTTQIATTAFVQTAVEAAQVGAAMFQGTVNANTDISGLSSYKKGYYWVVATAGTYVGETCEVGDMIFCIKDRGSSYAASDFSVVQNNLSLTAITNSEIDTIIAA